MPTAQYVCNQYNIHLTKEFPTPKRMGEMDAWYKAARKVIDDIPIVDQANREGWYITHQTASLETILFELENRMGVKAKLLIVRRSVVF